MQWLFIGMGLGLLAGVAPGPLLALLVSTSLQRGFGAGIRIALAPLFTDVPVLTAVLLILTQLSQGYIQAIGIIGGGYIIALGVSTFRRADQENPGKVREGQETHDFWKGILANFLSFSVWAFWAVIGGPLLLRAWYGGGWTNAGAFLTSYFSTAIGVKVAVAWGIARERNKLGGDWFARVLKISAVGLIVAGTVLAMMAALGLFGWGVRSQRSDPHYQGRSCSGISPSYFFLTLKTLNHSQRSPVPRLTGRIPQPVL